MYKTLEDVKRVIGKGVEKGIQKAIKSYLTGLDYSSWLKTKEELYTALGITISFDEWVKEYDSFEAQEEYTWPDCIQKMYNTHLGNEYAKQLKQGCPISLGFTIDCEPTNVNDFTQGLIDVLLLSKSETVLIMDYNNINHTLTQEEYVLMCQELKTHITKLREEKWVKQNKL